MTPPFLASLADTFQDLGGRPLAQVATVSPDGLPQVRTVVLRGLGEGTPYFASDVRSDKFEALATHPWLELCLFSPAAGVQWRLRGRASTHRDDALARRVWRALPPATQGRFHAPAPGRPLAQAGDARLPTSPPAQRPASFAVVRVAPDRCERLELGPPLVRWRWTQQGAGWTATELVP